MIKEIKRLSTNRNIKSIKKIGVSEAEYERKLIKTVCRLDVFFSAKSFHIEKDEVRKELTELFGEDFFKYSVEDGVFRIYSKKPSLYELDEINKILFGNFPHLMYLSSSNPYMIDYLHTFIHPNYDRLCDLLDEEMYEAKKAVLELIDIVDAKDNYSGRFFKAFIRSEYNIELEEEQSKREMVLITHRAINRHEIEHLYYSIDAVYRFYSKEKVR